MASLADTIGTSQRRERKTESLKRTLALSDEIEKNREQTVLVNDGGPFVARSKFHLVQHDYDWTTPALCGAVKMWNQRVSDRNEFERLCPERICSRCKAKDVKDASA